MRGRESVNLVSSSPPRHNPVHLRLPTALCCGLAAAGMRALLLQLGEIPSDAGSKPSGASSGVSGKPAAKARNAASSSGFNVVFSAALNLELFSAVFQHVCVRQMYAPRPDNLPVGSI